MSRTIASEAARHERECVAFYAAYVRLCGERPPHALTAKVLRLKGGKASAARLVARLRFDDAFGHSAHGSNSNHQSASA